jgi:hypothetical protein
LERIALLGDETTYEQVGINDRSNLPFFLLQL